MGSILCCCKPGVARDPLHMSGNIISNIVGDPHIDDCSKKYENILRSTGNQRKGIKNPKDIKKFATADKNQNQGYIEYINSINTALRENTVASTNILSFIINQIADVRQKQKVQNKFANHEQEYAALKCFIYLYTGNYSYNKINQMLNKNECQNLNKIIGVIKIQLKKYNTEFLREPRANTVHGRILTLYRGIPKPDKKMIKGQKMFWKSFVSTSISPKVANKFGRFTYKIELNTQFPHDYLIVPKQMSQFDQEEVILFPYFHFQCVDSQKYGNTASYMIQQIRDY